MRTSSLVTINRRTLALGVGLLAVAPVGRSAVGQDRGQIRIIVPFSAGTTIDALARGLAEALEPSLGRRPIVANRDGAAGTLAFVDLAQAEPDGLTLVFSGPTQLTVHPHLRREPHLDPAAYLPLCQVYELSFVLVASKASGIADVADLVRRAAAAPGTLRMGHQGRAAATHLQLMGFATSAGIGVNDIPYRAHGQMLADLANGQLDGAVLATGSFDPALVRPLAVFSERLSPVYPGVPTIGSFGYPISLQAFGGLFARAGLAPDRQAMLEEACRQAFERPVFRDIAARTGVEAIYGDHAAFAARLSGETQRMKSLLDRLGLTPN
ncbi:tripartite tricarboxylate transporter substrate binding protein [Phreatobacter aquaticus]|uniref:Tripartite tricarboxylate transporter substrate binding protein n=1 Tax=Phreatobacter aquaticus TaxID=2570229 RepID=A0A4D7QH94_9HYPH|nr:tripartite tricarboxylate transporter substrate binding protein [Phreatobacter aquaticus]QCK86678.1 tripartite tricarboxylate transporter substrate binding protein [Phreatobacter aquaticus]